MGAFCDSTKNNSKKDLPNIRNSNSKNANVSEVPNAELNPNMPLANTLAFNKMKERLPNSKNYIKDLKNQTLIKKINEVDGDQMIIESCSNSTIIVLDYSSQVTIEKCLNCNIFIGPCKSRNSNDINIITACQQFRARNCSNIKLSLFVLTKPAIEDCPNFQLGCFNFDYTGITDTFQSAELNFWENQWSEYNLFSGDPVIYIDASKVVEYFKELKMNVLVDQEVVQKEYLTIPYTHGLSFDYKEPSYSHGITIFDGSINIDDLLVFFDPNQLEFLDCFLIKTFEFKKADNIADEIMKLDPASDEFMTNRENFIGMWIIGKKNENSSYLCEMINQNFEGLHYSIFDTNVGKIKDCIMKLFEKYNFK